jgi:tRNA-specific 2-thiouridylase
MDRTIAIALSGGIDSLMTAALLKEQGHRLIGVHFLTGFEPAYPPIPYTQTNAGGFKHHGSQALAQLAPKADQLNIPIHIVDLRAEFKKEVVDYFVQTYQTGQTPNPCLKCNPSIKFDALFQRAKALGATHIATGHYARLKTDTKGRPRLFCAADRVKDQSYFLSRLRRNQLHRALFPLGAYTKDQTRRMAEERGIAPITPQESQDICFIRNKTYGEFLAQQPEFTPEPGPITDLDGCEVGRHPGLHLYTIGQRRGINCPSTEPFYVVRIDTAQNRLVVGRKKDLTVSSFDAYDINWITAAPQHPIHLKVRVRYRHQPVHATVYPTGAVSAQITFDMPQPGVTPGQGVAFYLGDEVLGGGWIR